MALPEFNEFGDLPAGNHPASLAEVFSRFGSGTSRRAAVFWVRPDMLLGEPLDQFLAFWQTKRDGRRRGIVEGRRHSLP